jgi:ribose transport system ATP-binding protein
MARKLGIATVFQEVMVADEASVVDNLFIGTDDFWYKAMTQGEKVKKAEVLMEELVGEYVNPHTLASTLSLPIKAWITIGRAFLREDTKVLILDESSAALDFDSTERLFTKMRQLRDKGVAVFIVTHRIAELVRISDKATVMRDGIDVGVLEKEEITEKNLLKLMTGRSDTGDKTKNSASKSQSDNVILRTHDLKVWEESDPINLDLHEGEILGVTGLDGHGQDDFVKILAGVQSGYGGYVEVKNDNHYEKYKTLIEAKKKGIFFVS